MNPWHRRKFYLTRGEGVFALLATLFAGALAGVGIGAPAPKDWLSAVESASLVFTLCVVIWSTFEVRAQRVTSQAQLEVAKRDLDFARAREEASERSAQARAGLIAYALRRQLVAWLEPDVEDFQGGGDAVLVALMGRLARDSFWESVQAAETRLEELVEIAPTLSVKSSDAVTSVVKAFYGTMDNLNSYCALDGIHGGDPLELQWTREGLEKTAGLLAEALVPRALLDAQADRNSLMTKFRESLD